MEKEKKVIGDYINDDYEHNEKEIEEINRDVIDELKKKSFDEVLSEEEKENQSIFDVIKDSVKNTPEDSRDVEKQSLLSRITSRIVNIIVKVAIIIGDVVRGFVFGDSRPFNYKARLEAAENLKQTKQNLSKEEDITKNKDISENELTHEPSENASEVSEKNKELDNLLKLSEYGKPISDIKQDTLNEEQHYVGVINDITTIETASEKNMIKFSVGDSIESESFVLPKYKFEEFFQDAKSGDYIEMDVIEINRNKKSGYYINNGQILNDKLQLILEKETAEHNTENSSVEQNYIQPKIHSNVNEPVNQSVPEIKSEYVIYQNINKADYIKHISDYINNSNMFENCHSTSKFDIGSLSQLYNKNDENIRSTSYVGICKEINSSVNEFGENECTLKLYDGNDTLVITVPQEIVSASVSVNDLVRFDEESFVVNTDEQGNPTEYGKTISRVKDENSLFYSNIELVYKGEIEKYKEESDSDIDKINQSKASTKASCVGVISDITETENGHVSFTLSDKKSDIQCICKSNAYNQVKDMINKGESIRVMGKTEVFKDELGDKNVRITVKGIETLPVKEDIMNNVYNAPETEIPYDEYIMETELNDFINDLHDEMIQEKYEELPFPEIEANYMADEHETKEHEQSMEDEMSL